MIQNKWKDRQIDKRTETRTDERQTDKPKKSKFFSDFVNKYNRGQL